MNKIIAILAIAIFLISGCGQITGETIKNEQIKVGVAIPLTGWGTYYGHPLQKGMNIAEEESNIQLIYEDSKGTGKDAVTAAKKLIHANKVDILFTSFTPPTHAVSPIAKASQTPFIYDAYIESPLEENKFAFKINFNAKEGCKKIVQIAKQTNKYQKLSAIMSNTEYNHLCLEGAREIEPNIDVFWYEFGEKDFRTLLLKTKNHDAILTIGWEQEEMVPLFTQKSELNINTPIICATEVECIGTNVKKTVPKETLEGTMAIGFKNIQDTTFAKKFKTKYPAATESEINFAAIGYETILTIADATKDCQDKDCILTQLNQPTKHNTVFNSTGFKDRKQELELTPYVYENNKWDQISPR
ncbi:ABC transporter substrate-binding protein [Candidatus Woesearchaeota archaeon]|jgi:ABC-type branched-subunit amino acid transport system substrate-binding protein|nr:ABC transporter substrate-binding protein [Candidatus Woesearchaeota archaeon]MBT3538320.1 ABC transporter substrate-binding protein [Candidatus Woesearchaeota archaeon]MBT4698297.1 ABC transporter substrate-binding protein [Candidatus Woesearchaeota archaeon]MBT4716804.1 ABC transporter substrate-binding protein [Candidatus Woesearchaeota archaeon]MBT7105989.1 ABC transporter substrate-binding protein [Candidatus Woesearchaeota archaeon]